VDTTGKRVVSHAGAVLLVATAGKVGLDRTLSAALAPWRKQWALLDPGKILLDLAISVAVGGDCLADIGVLRSEPAVFGRVASDSTVSRLIDALAATPTAALAAINQARAVFNISHATASRYALIAGALLDEQSEPPEVSYRILLSWKDVKHAEEDRSGAARSCGASGC